MAKPTKRNIRTALRAAKLAERVLPYFEKKYPKDKRPRKAIVALRAWARTGVFSMSVIRKASLAAHAAARKAPENSAARAAAHAAGQAAAVAHVVTHAGGVEYYAKKAVKLAKQRNRLK
jgi:hypothetical protein